MSSLLPLFIFSLGATSVISQGTSLLGGKYVATTDVESWANLSLDARDMKNSNDFDEKKRIYTNGRNSYTILTDGTKVLRSLASLSLDSFSEMKEDPFYSFFRHAFLSIGSNLENEELGSFDERPVTEYGNTLVLDLFALNVSHIKAEASIILNVWIWCVHELYNLLRACEQKDVDSQSKMNAALDIAAALWIGTDQSEGDNNSGNLLYNLAEQISVHFNQDHSEAEVNSAILTGFRDIQLNIAKGTCTSDASGYIKIRSIIKRLFGLMTVPLVQTLIHHIMEPVMSGKSNFIELYTLAIAARVEACNTTAFNAMLSLFVVGDFNEDNKDKAIQLIQNVYPCLDMSCKDVGKYRSNEGCLDNSSQFEILAGYPTTFNVEQYANIDKDIAQITVMLKARAYAAAKDYYLYGYNAQIESDKLLSLHDLATSVERRSADFQFARFTAYFGFEDYADKIMGDLFDRVVPFDQASTSQIVEAGAGTMTYMISYMSSLSKFYHAVEICTAGGGSNATDESNFLWDQGVAFFVGSIEGSEPVGLEGGQLLFGSSNKLCAEFDVCVKAGYAKVNQDLLNAFKSGSNFLTLGECDEVERILEDTIVPSLPVPLIQGTLKAAAMNAKLNDGTNESSLALGHAFANSILPIVDAASQSNARTISSNMQFQLTTKPVPDGATAVFEAFQAAISSMATNCEQIGVYANGTFGLICPGSTLATNPMPLDTPIPAPVYFAPSATMTPMTLGFGRYSFTSEVTSIARISRDVRDIQQEQNALEANNTYLNGKNAVVNRSGIEAFVSLSEFSLKALTYMSQDPMFNIFRWALGDEYLFNQNGNNASTTDSTFADIVVQKAFSAAQDVGLAAETAVVMNVWMEITHDLYNSVRFCKDATEKAGESIDRAVSLWLGEDQTAGSFSTGNLLYHITQQAAQHLGQSEGEASINNRLLKLFVDAKAMTSKCEINADTFKKLRLIIADILVKMTVPLIQNLLYYIDTLDENKIELYALAVIPQAIACGEANFAFLRDTLVNEAEFDANAINTDFFDSMRIFQQCLRITCDDLMEGMNPYDSLRTLILNQCYDPGSVDSFKLAGYLPTSNISEVARIDLDILQIGIFMETLAYDAAMDYYTTGFNSKATSLQEIATSKSRMVVATQYDLYSSFFNSTTYAHDIVMQALQGQAPFTNASTSQRADATVRTLQTMVSYMAILEQLYLAADSCRNVTSETDLTGVVFWETGVALFIGSIEGHSRGGDYFGDGTLLYSLAKGLCGFFDTCEGSGDAAINEFLIDAFDDGRNLLLNNDCDGVDAIIREEILGSLPVPLIQGTLYESYVNFEFYNATEPVERASGFILAQSVLPLIKNATSAKTIKKEMALDFSGKPLQSDVDAVFGAFAFSVSDMNIDCQDVSTLGNTSLCSIGVRSDNGDGVRNSTEDPVFQPKPETPTILGDGLYKTTTYVQDRANIALDVISIRKALDSNSSTLAQILYKDGFNSVVYDKDGVKTALRSFSKFSTEDTLAMRAESYFNIFTYALEDTPGQYHGIDVRLYADTIINELFESPREDVRNIATEGILVLNLWMTLVHELEQNLLNCKEKKIADTDGIHSIDQAVAYWIGDGQISGDGEKGHLLYALSERMGEFFGIVENGQSRTNTNILRLFNQARLELSFPSACSENPNTYPRLRQIFNKIISQMTIPLIQSLIHNLQENDRDRVKMYAQAFSPLVAACNPTLFAFLKDKLINLNYNVIEVEAIVDKIRDSYDCLGVSCDDVGEHRPTTGKVCIDTPMLNSLAGYRPSHDVRSYALLDLDILECSILLSHEAFAACEDVYLYGKHATVYEGNEIVTLSLSQLATTSDRTIVPRYEQFVQYFDSDNNYADTLIMRAMYTTDFPGASGAQRKEIVVKSMQYLVLFMSILQQMYESLQDCNSDDALTQMSSSGAWDRAAALLIGSMEGTEDGGTLDGQSFYALSKSTCLQFGTCEKSGSSEVNQRITSLLYTGRGEVQAGSCTALRRTVDEIEPLLLVPIIQSTLQFAIENEKIPAGSQDGALAGGYISSIGVLPVVDSINRESATTIEKNLLFQLNSKPVPDGSRSIFNAFAPVYASMGVDCEMVGGINGIDACKGASRLSSGGSGKKAGLISGLVLLVVALFVSGTYAYIKRPFRRSKSCDEPSFIRNNNGELNYNNGELNYNDDLLSGKLNDADVITSDELYDKEVAEQAPIV